MSPSKEQVPVARQAIVRPAAETAMQDARRGSGRRFVAKAVIIASLACWLIALIAWLIRPYLKTNFSLELTEYEQVYEGLTAVAIYFAIAGLLILTILRKLSGERREWERILELILAEKKHLARMMAGSMVMVISELSLPMGLYYLLKDVVNTRQQHGPLIVALIALVGLMLLRAAAGYLRQYNAQALAYNISAKLRERLYAHLQRMNFAFFDRARQGELMSTVTNDVERLQFFMLTSNEDFIVAPLKVLLALGAVFFLNWQLALVILVIMPLIAVLLRIGGSRLRKVNHAAQEWLGKLTAELAEGINTIRLAQGFGLEGNELSKFREVNRTALSKLLSHSRVSAVLLPSIEVLGFIGPLVIIGVLCWQAIAAGMPVDTEQLVAIAGYGGLVANPLGKLSRIMVTLSVGEAASARIHKILETKAEIVDKHGAVELNELDGHISFNHVSLRYGPKGPLVLDNVSLDIRPGEVVALVGESGSGKSSLLNLVPRFYEVSDGSIMLDGHELRDIRLASLRQHIGVVSQDTILVHGTVRENISYGSPGSDEKDIIDAAISANAHNFIMEFPLGYDTLVGERGVTLSGGQRQRIAIARALLRDPQILLLDEATSALDSVSEAVVQDALNKLMYGRTTLMIAHRLSTVRKANRIIVLRAGSIVEEGTHEELMEYGDGEYARLVKLQGLD